MHVPANFNKLLEPGLRKIWGDAYNAYPAEYTKFCEVHTSTRAFEEDQEITGGMLVPEKPIGRSIDYMKMYQGLTKRYTFLTYGLGFLVARELLEDDQYRRISQMPKVLARCDAMTVDIMATNILNRAFNPNYPGADGQPLCSTAHPLLAGGTMSNTLSTPADLDITSFEQALIDIASFVDGSGNKIMVKPKQLIVHPFNDFNAQYILKSEKLPDSANQNINPAKGLIPYIVLHYLTDPDAWFIQTDVENGINFFWRRKPEFASEDMFDTENAAYKTTFRCDVGFTDFRCIFGSPGA